MNKLPIKWCRISSINSSCGCCCPVALRFCYLYRRPCNSKSNVQHVQAVKMIHPRSLTAKAPESHDGWKTFAFHYGLVPFKGRTLKLQGCTALEFPKKHKLGIQSRLATGAHDNPVIDTIDVIAG